MSKTLLFFISLLIICNSIYAREYHVSTKGNDTDPGTKNEPFRTISAAAFVALTGDTITVHEGTYRERIDPIRSGTENKPIVYRCAEGEKVQIKGSEIINNWVREDTEIWKITLPNSFFGEYNPYKDVIDGDWFVNKDRIHHTGEVYLNAKSLYEVSSLEDIKNPKPLKDALDKEGSLYVWYCETDEENTFIYANFGKSDPNRELVEINVRPTCFYPSKPGINYITVRGFHMSQAATQWAPPTAEQIGLIGTHWSKGWIIEDNVISDSKCSGITLGKDRETGQNVWSNNPEKDGSVHYIEVIFRAREAGWEKDNIGSHIVRNNTIFNCEQTGICGSLGAVFSTITGNHIYNIWQKRQFDGPEIAAIKIHGAIDMLISKNHIHNSTMGFFLDWMAQGTRITSNLMYENDITDIYMEVNHGPFVIDNNFLLSPLGIMSMSQGGAYIHNLIAGKVKTMSDTRFTPYFYPHSTHLSGFANIYAGDDRWYKNIFTATSVNNSPAMKGVFLGGSIGLSTYDENNAGLPVYASGNIYYGISKLYSQEKNSIKNIEDVPVFSLYKTDDKIFLEIELDNFLYPYNNRLINSDLLGKTKVSNLPYQNYDSSLLLFETDYFGERRDSNNPMPGPVEKIKEGHNVFQLK